MRRTILTSILVLWSTLALAQSTSPDVLFERGMDAITGVGPLQNDALGIDYFGALPISATGRPRSHWPTIMKLELL